MNIVNTLRCNFTCDHCLWTCGPNKNEYINRDTIMKAVDMFDTSIINFLGGETFMHPDIIWQLEYLSNYSEWLEYMRIVTNGTMIVDSDNCLTPLAEELASSDINWRNIYVFVSDDIHHQVFTTQQRIDKAKQFFEGVGATVERSYGQYYHNGYSPLGRARTNDLYYREDDHPECSDVFYYREEEPYANDPLIMPNGDVSPACCGHNIVGNVHYHNSGEIQERIGMLKFKKHRDPRKRDCVTCPKYAKIPGVITNMQVKANTLKETKKILNA